MIKENNIDTSDFTIRQPNLKIWHMALIGICIAAALIISVNSDSSVIHYAVIFIVTISIIGLLYLVQNRGIDLRTATEFQAMVFSGAMRINSILTLVIRRDGSIFYLDPRYAKDFTNGASYHNLDQFLDTLGLEKENKIQIYDSIRDLKKSEFEYSYKSGRQSSPVRIGVYPLARPDGFVVMTVNEQHS